MKKNMKIPQLNNIQIQLNKKLLIVRTILHSDYNLLYVTTSLLKLIVLTKTVMLLLKSI